MSQRFFGQYLVQRGVVSAGTLAKAVSIQESVNRTFGQIAHSMGLLTLEEVSRVNRAQRTYDMLYGDMAVKMGLLTDNQVAQVLEEQRRNHLYIGEALVRLGALDKQRLDTLLDEFAREQVPSVTGLELPDDVPLPHFCLIAWDTSKKMLSRLVNLIIKPGTCELVNQVEANDIAVLVDLAGDVTTRYIITFPSQVRDKIAQCMTSEDSGQLDEIFCSNKSGDEAVVNFAAIICTAIISKMAGVGVNLVPINCEVLEDDDIPVHGGNIALLFPFYLSSGEWIDVAVVLPT